MMDGKPIRNKLIGTDDQRAVSPVISVTLMVTITVSLAAVIAAIVLDMGGSLNEEAQAGVNVEMSRDTTQVTWTTEGNSDSVNIEATIAKPDHDGNSSDIVEIDGASGSTDSFELGSVGASNTVTVVDSQTSSDNLNGDSQEFDVRFVATATAGDSDTVVQDSVETVIVEDQT